MAGLFLTGALLLPVLLAAHLFAAQTLARHAPPACPCSAPAVEVMYTSRTNDGPSPATGHRNQPSPRMAQDGGAVSGDPDVSAASETRATFSGHSTAPDESPRNVSHQRNTAGVGKAPGVRP